MSAGTVRASAADPRITHLMIIGAVSGLIASLAMAMFDDDRVGHLSRSRFLHAALSYRVGFHFPDDVDDVDAGRNDGVGVLLLLWSGSAGRGDPYDGRCRVRGDLRRLGEDAEKVRPMLLAAGLVWGAVVFLFSAFVALPVMAAVFSSGDQITHMAQLAGWGTFFTEHLVFGLALAAVRMLLQGRSARSVCAAV